ncbi:hypothetical protein GCM10027093_68520 [Paraburkholderia jirisanensis]
MAIEHRAFASEFDGLRLADQKHSAQFLLQQPHRAADCRLGDMQGRGRPAKAAAVYDLGKIAECADVQVSLL